jgi:elongation factor Ts
VLVALDSTGDYGQLEALGKQLAMHIAAANPLALTGEELDPSTIERERAIATEKANESGKPADIVARMVDGAIAKYRKENALLSQLFVMDNKTRVEDVVKGAAKTAGAPVELKAYVRFQLGEGIEKQQSDFAAEVAAVSGIKQ